jgi:V8-like Glu-specific endopeptidase
MKLKPLVVFLIASASINPTFATQTNTGVLGKENDAVAASVYWTAERLKDAKPFESSVDSNKVIKLDPTQVPPSDAKALGEDGKPPSSNINPSLHFLYKSDSNLTEAPPSNSGSRNEQFSSSRLIPLAADLNYPYRAVGKLFFTASGGNYVCSASVIKPRLVLTAGHCVHSGSGGNAGFYSNFLFIPAFRDGSNPYGSWATTYVNVTTAWATGGGQVPNAADYAMLEIQDQSMNGSTQKIGNVTGYLGYQLQSLMPNHVHQLGYPCNLDSCAKMHQVTSQSAVAISPNNVEYGSDMSGGASGGPWVQNFGEAASGQTGGNNPGMNRVVGVTSWGYTNPAAMALGASIFDNRFTALLNTMCNHQSGNC